MYMSMIIHFYFQHLMHGTSVVKNTYTTMVITESQATYNNQTKDGELSCANNGPLKPNKLIIPRPS